MRFTTVLKAAGSVILGGAAALAGASVVKDCKKSKTSEDCKDDAGSDEDELRSVEDALNNKSSDD